MVFMRPRSAFIINPVFQLIDRLNDCIHVVFVQTGNTFFVDENPSRVVTNKTLLLPHFHNGGFVCGIPVGY